MRYIKGTLDLKLVFSKKLEQNRVMAYADVDWGGDLEDRKSTSGYCCCLYGSLISWVSKKQGTVAMSTTESEYIALSSCISEACWVNNMLFELCIIEFNHTILIFEDNQSTIKVCSPNQQLKRIKHLDIKFHFVRDKIKSGVVELKYIKTADQIADLFTKPLCSSVFVYLRDKMLN